MIQNKFVFIANHPGLDFINTLIVARNHPLELLDEPEDLLRWMFDSYLLSSQDLLFVEQNWLHLGGGDIMRSILADARRLRQAAHQALLAPSDRDTALAVINEYLSLAAVAARLVPSGDGYLLQEYPDSPHGLLSLIARQVSAIFTELDPSLVKKCRNDKCVLYFYDSSKNRARTWCSMDLCGNRAKAAKHYQTHANQVP